LPVRARSAWWRSAAWPDPKGPEYRNGVALVEANGPPQTVLEGLFSIEQAFDRMRAAKNAPRTLDLDLIAYGRQVIDAPGLQVPHPRAHERRFVMGPLAELAPGWVHPVLGRTAAELAATATVGRDAAPVSLP
jgi:2-amino-4-hydroxy-6-hydroxymethyldihydropteridine diphosphokinase